LKRVVKYFMLFAVTLLFTGSIVSYAAADSRGTITEILKRRNVRIYTNLLTERYQFKDYKNRPAGFAVDLAKMIAAQLNVDLVLTDVSWDGLIPALLTKKSDFLVTTMSTTFPRAQKVLFTSETWYTTGISIWTREKDGYKNWNELIKKGATVGAVNGSVSAEVAKAYFVGTKLQTYKLDTDVFEALKTGRIDACINDNIQKFTLLEHYPEFELLTKPREFIKTDDYAFVCRPGDEFTWHFLNFFLCKIKADGQLEALEKYWTVGNKWKKDYINGKSKSLSAARKQVIELCGIQDYEPGYGKRYRVINK
jgi:ABC-type amino acid transport substrate-binding protein